MYKFLIIGVVTLVFFLIEFFLFNLGGRWFMPNLLLLLIMFMNLYLGIRYSILTACLAGLLKESVSPQLFGFYLFPFLVSAYMTTLLKSWVYHTGSQFSRGILIFLVLLIYLGVSFVIYTIFHNIGILDVLKYIFLPQIVLTLLVANPVFKILKICVSKLYV